MKTALFHRPLNPFEKWMVKSNMQYVPAEGIETVCARLRAAGYPQIAAGVEAQVEADAKAIANSKAEGKQ